MTFPHKALLGIALLVLAGIGLFALSSVQNETATLFTLLSAQESGVAFENTVQESKEVNVLAFEYAYNGGGVAIGDINNDGLADLYLTANLGSNALYLNKGNLEFEDITQQSTTNDDEGWSTGVTMVDINADGFLDIYVCKTGHGDPKDRRNKLFINNGDLTFTERAKEFGLDDTGYSTHASFFDFDKDGDLDVYLISYAVKRYNKFDILTIRKELDPYAGDKFLRNDDGTFTDISKEAGIIQNPIGFGLSATAGDINMDGWMDIYVTNDFMERDYLYINQQDGTFQEQITLRTDLISYYSMGSDIADFNNDALPDIVTVDMLAEDYERRKTLKQPDYSNYNHLAQYGYHHQNMRNMLHLNNGNGTFSEIGQLAGLAETDWSWAALLSDFDNDGFKDLYVTNGFSRDYTDLDYLNNILWKQYPNEGARDNPDELLRLVQLMPQTRLNNYSFKNLGDLRFQKTSKPWGLEHNATSTGAAYGDLDNDGDLDLVVNNINERAFVYQNNTQKQEKKNYLKVRLQGTGKNTLGIGGKVTLSSSSGHKFYQEMNPTRGYQSSMEPVLTFGLGDIPKVAVEVVWNSGSVQKLENIEANQMITINQADAQVPTKEQQAFANNYFSELDKNKTGLVFKHAENSHNDFNQTPLLPHTFTNLGPALTVADANNDGLQDFFIGGAKGQNGQVFFQQTDGTFQSSNQPFLELHKEFEDISARFFDADNDADLDLYVVSGGNFSSLNNATYQDRLYLNDGFGNFSYSEDALPVINSSGSIVAVSDYDRDGDNDLFIGGRILTNKYPQSPQSYILENQNGNFVDVTQAVSSQLQNPGMVSSAVWLELTGDEFPELIISGEWMPVRIFQNANGKRFEEITEQAGMEFSNGWWNSLKASDLDLDGDLDLIAGNRGLNSSLTASRDKPTIIYAGDFDNNGITDPIITHYEKGKQYPIAYRDELLFQVSSLRSKYTSYSSFAEASIQDILTSNQKEKALQLKAYTFESSVFENKGDGTFSRTPLPAIAQTAPLFDFIIADFNSDQIPDILTAGNNSGTPSRQGPMLANRGSLLLGNGKLGFNAISSLETGFDPTGDVRNIDIIQSALGPIVLIARNNAPLLPYLFTGQQKESASN